MKLNQFLRLMYFSAEEHGEDACWPWPRSTNGRYGNTRFRNRAAYTHRVAWEIANNREVPEGLLVCHSCDNPLCFNPAHLWIGTDADNMRDKREKGRDRPPYQGRTHCKHGHELVPATTRVRPINGRPARECLICVYAKQNHRNAIKRALITHCKRGHEFTPENTTWCAGPRPGVRSRRCRTCDRDHFVRVSASRRATTGRQDRRQDRSA